MLGDRWNFLLTHEMRVHPRPGPAMLGLNQIPGAELRAIQKGAE